jgi:hypothetical protein
MFAFAGGAIDAFPRTRSVIQDDPVRSRARRPALHGELSTVPGPEGIEEEGEQMLDSEVDF